MKANLSNLFLLGEAFGRSAVRAELSYPCNNGDIDKWIVGDCTKPITFNKAIGNKYYDLIGTTESAIDLISLRVLGVLKKEGISGMANCPIEFTDGHGKLILGYEMLGTTGRCGSLDNSRSPKVSKLNKDRH